MNISIVYFYNYYSNLSRNIKFIPYIYYSVSCNNHKINYEFLLYKQYKIRIRRIFVPFLMNFMVAVSADKTAIKFTNKNQNEMSGQKKTRIIFRIHRRI